uniref:Single CXXC unit domain-containing protein n=1 Tax=Macrostomum lignano TaxID=282301 RepID=A0A1I8JKT5_9PLAT
MEPPFGRFPPASGSGPSRNRAYTTLDDVKAFEARVKLATQQQYESCEPKQTAVADTKEEESKAEVNNSNLETSDTKKVTKKDEKLYKASSVAPATSPAPKRCQSGVDGAKNRSSESGVPPSPSSCCRPKTAPARLSAA